MGCAKRSLKAWKSRRRSGSKGVIELEPEVVIRRYLNPSETHPTNRITNFDFELQCNYLLAHVIWFSAYTDSK